MNVAIVGAGASGLMAAITAAEYGAGVTIYEYNPEPAKKLLRTGNGRCNISNNDLSERYFYSSDYKDTDDHLKPSDYLNSFDNTDTVAFFRNLGLLLVDNNNYLYPYCGQASVVRDLLLNRVKELGVELVLNSRINKIEPSCNGQYRILNSGELSLYDRVILSCGSYAGLSSSDRIDSKVDGYSLAYGLGAHILPVKPALSGIIVEDNLCKAISGVRATAEVKLISEDKVISSDCGEVQFTDYGVSGIPAMNISRFINIYRDCELYIDLLPGLSDDEWMALKKGRLLQLQGSKVSRLLSGMINSKIVDYLISSCGINPDILIEDVPDEDKNKLFDSCRHIVMIPKSVRSFQHAQVCMGGVSMVDVNKDFGLLSSPGVYITGEMLDVDCRCGGYNLQWAWTSGYIAGKAAAMLSRY